MGLSLSNITKKIGDVVGGVERQVNPFDNGQTYSNPQGNGQQQSVVQQLTHAPQMVINADKHIINAGRDIGQGVLGAGAPLGSEIYNRGVAPLLGLPQQTFTPPKVLQPALGNKPILSPTQVYRQSKGAGKSTGLALGLAGLTAASALPIGGPEAKSAEEAIDAAKPLVRIKTPTSDFESLAQTAPTTADKVMANTTGSTPEVAMSNRMAVSQRLEADTAALNHLKSGGTRDEATKIYQDATGRSAKQSQYRVQQLAKQAKTPLNVSPKVPNPLSGQFHLPTAKAGDYLKAPQNQMTVTKNIDLATKEAQDAFKPLSLSDRQAVRDVVEGVKKSDNPAVQKAATASQKLTDTVHALGEPYGSTPHIMNYFPRYFADHPEQSPTAQMAIEEAAVGGKPIPLEDAGNYAGFHNKSRIFKTNQEALQAGFKNMHEDPLQDLQRYASGAKINIGNQAFIKAAREAGVTEPATGQLHTIDLPGQDAVRVSDKGYRVLKNFSNKGVPGIVKKTLQGASRMVVKTIVANPLFHGGNQEVNAAFNSVWKMPGNRVANMGKFLKNQAGVSEADKEAFYREGNFSPTYGKDQYGFIAKGLEKAGIDPKNAELSPRAMANLEQNIRVALWKVGKDRGMAPDELTKTINSSLGSPDILNDMSTTFGLFTHYLKTNTKLLADIPISAVKGDFGPAGGAIAAVVAYNVANKAWQAATGNPNASIRAPGFVGTAMQYGKAPVQIKHGQIPSIVTSHTNPIVTTALEQATNRDFRKPVVGPQAQTNNLDKNRVGSAASNLAGPALTIQNVQAGKHSIPEAALSLGVGAYTPHAKGYQAAPNIPILNQPKDKSGNGLAQQNQYFNAHDKLLASVAGTPRANDAVNTYLNRNRTPDGKTTIQLDPKESLTNARALVTSDKARNSIQTFEQSQKSHDPMWDLSANQLKTFLNYKAQIKDSADQINIRDQNPWIFDTEAKQNAFYNALPKSDNPPQKSPFAQQHPYPLSDAESALMVQAAKITDPQAKSAFYNQHPELAQIDQKNGEYINQVRANEDAPPLPAPPKANDSTQAFLDRYIPADKAARTSIRTSDPNGYAGMQSYLTQSSLYNLVKQASVDELSGNAAGDQKLLKAAYSLGQYDVVKNTDGTYSMGNSTSGGGSGSGGSYSKGSSYTKRRLEAGNFSVNIDAGNPKDIKLRKTASKGGKVRLAKPPARSSIALKGKPTVSSRKSMV